MNAIIIMGGVAMLMFFSWVYGFTHGWNAKLRDVKEDDFRDGFLAGWEALEADPSQRECGGCRGAALAKLMREREEALRQ